MIRIKEKVIMIDKMKTNFKFKKLVENILQKLNKYYYLWGSDNVHIPRHWRIVILFDLNDQCRFSGLYTHLISANIPIYYGF